MEYVWNQYGICMEYVWNKYRICMEYVWDKYGMCLEMYGIGMEAHDSELDPKTDLGHPGHRIRPGDLPET